MTKNMSPAEIIEEELNANYTAALTKLYETTLDPLFKEHGELLARYNLRKLTHSGARIKKKLVETLLAFLEQPNLIELYLRSLSDKCYKVVQKLVWEGPSNLKSLEQETGLQIMTRQKKRYSFEFKLKKEFLFLEINSTRGHYYFTDEQDSTKIIVDLHPLLPFCFKPLIPTPNGYHLNPLTKIEKTEYCYQNRDSILKEVTLLVSSIQEGHMQVGKNGKLLKASARKLRSLSNSEEFYPGIKQLDTLSIELKSNLLQSMVTKLEADEPLTLLQKIYKKYQQGYFEHCPLMNHLTGWKRVQDYRGELSIHKEVNKLFRQLPVEQWISIPNIVKYIRLRKLPLIPVHTSDAKEFLYAREEGRYSDIEKVYYSAGNYEHLLLAPLIQALFFLFASLGLFDLAYDQPENNIIQTAKKKYLSVYDGLKYVRLTKLGAFIIGNESNYEASVNLEEEAEISVDSRRLMITLSKHDKLKELALEKFSNHIGGNRYQVTYESFLSDCIQNSDIQRKIKYFKNQIPGKLPEIWESFFQELLAKAHPLQRKSGLIIYQLKNQDEEIIKLISSDPVLKNLILKVEQFHICLEKSDLDKLKRRLKQFGYIL